MDKDLKEKLAAYLMKDADKEETTEEVKEEKGDEKDIEKMKAQIADSIAKQVEEKLASAKAVEESKEKAVEVNAVNASPKIDVTEYKKSIYTKKNGEQLEVTKGAGIAIQDWYKSVSRRNYDEADKKRLEIESKFAHLVKNGVEPMNETVAADGGVLVPTILANFIVEIKDDKAKMRALADSFNMTGMSTNTLDVSKELTTPRLVWGGVEQYDADKSTTSAQYEKQSLTPYTVAAIATITNQLIADSPFNMIQRLSEQLGRAMATEEDRVAINGTGINQPTGISTYTASSTIAAGKNLTFDNMNAAYWAMRESYRTGAVWIMNSSRMSLVQGLKDSQNRPIYLPATLTGQPPMINNLPVIENNNVANTSIYLVNMKYYMWAYKDGLIIDIADQASVGSSDPINLWMRNMKAVRAEARYDAELLDVRALCEITSP